MTLFQLISSNTQVYIEETGDGFVKVAKTKGGGRGGGGDNSGGKNRKEVIFALLISSSLPR